MLTAKFKLICSTSFILASINDQQFKPWIPSIADISVVFVNMGVEFRSLFPLQHLQPPFNEQDIL